MKKIIFILLVINVRVCCAQTDTVLVNDYQTAINLLFGNLPLSHYPSGVLLDKASRIPKMVFANGAVNDSSFNMIEWYSMYENIRISRVDSTKWLNFFQLDSIKNKYIDSTNTLPIGILDFYAHKLKDSAFIDGSLMPINHSLFEMTNDLSKIYKSVKVFSIVPLNLEVNTLSPSFVIPQNMFFSNNQNAISQLQIDLDDGLGYRNVNFNTNFSANYLSAGYKLINSRIIYTNSDTLYSKAEVLVNDPNVLNNLARATSNGYNYTFDVSTKDGYIPNEFTHSTSYGKATCGVWLGCGNADIRKPIIVFSGYNPQNGKDLVENSSPKWWTDLVGPIFALAGWRGTFYETYNGVYTDYSSGPAKSGDNGNNLLNKLNSEGYDIIICKFADGIGYLQNNALVVAAVIKEVNRRKRQSTNPGASINPYEFGTTNGLMKSNHENIIIGYSAGGLCSRMALTMMEKYPNNFGLHHTKTWVSFDCENQGSNVPIGFQMLLDFLANSIPSIHIGDWINTFISKKTLDIIKTSGVSTQNSLSHINHLYHTGGSSWDVNQDNDFNDYFSDLNAVTASYVPLNLKGYPINCRRIGISQGNSNGLMNNLGDATLVNYQSPATNNSYGLGVSPFRTGAAFSLTNSNSNALYCRAGVVVNFLFISYVIEFNHWKYRKNNYINNHKIYDIQPGSTLPSHIIFGKKTLGGELNSIGAFLLGVEKTYSDKQHGFSPTVSSLDIHIPGNNYLPRFPDFNLTPVNQGLLRINNYSSVSNYAPNVDFGYPHINHPNDHYDITPYDAVYAIGNPVTDYFNNQMHVEDPQPLIADFLTEELAPPTLYLSSRLIWDDADFEARNSVLAGNQDIYKHYDAFNPYRRLQTPPGDFIISGHNGSTVTMRANNGDGQSTVTLGPGFSAKEGCIFRAYVYGDTYCQASASSHRESNSTVQNNAYQRPPRPIISSKQAKNKIQNNAKFNVTAYPNPSNGIIHFDFEENDTYLYVITNVLGNTVKSGEISPAQNEIDLQDLNSGVYFITISNPNYKQTEQIILQ